MEDEEYENTTPDAKNIYRTLGVAYALGARAAVIEVSSQAVAQERIFGIPFKALVFTNFSPDHIGFGEHLDIDEYYSAKKRLFFENSSALAVVNSDDGRGLDISSASEGVITVGTDRGADFYIGNISFDCRGVEFNLCGVPFSLPFGGGYNAYNAALAAALLREVFSLDLVRCSSRLRSVRVRGRYESYSLSGRTVIIDFAHNAESFRAICESARAVCCGRLILVFGSVGGRSFLRRRELAEAAELCADISVITSDNPGDEAPLKICNDIYSAFSDKSRAVIVIDRAEAIRRALSLSAEGDFILLLGKGHEEYQKISGKRVRFSEREIIKSLGASEML
jgi:UDP-N-acetylmuramoyl-L-alanyl-D-glutamate--2,6-diaminopimelate ligase